MAAVTVTVTSVCSGGNHFTIAATGDASRTIVVDRSEVLSAITEQDAETFIKVLVKIGKIGRTNAQVLALFQSGVTVTV